MGLGCRRAIEGRIKAKEEREDHENGTVSSLNLSSNYLRMHLLHAWLDLGTRWWRKVMKMV